MRMVDPTLPNGSLKTLKEKAIKDSTIKVGG